MTAVPTNNLLNQINSAWPKERWLGFNVLVASSGGADSVALLKALAEIRKTSGSDASGLLIVANFNHRLRGEESDGDSEFVRDLAGELELEFHAGVAESAAENPSSSENDLRDQRYDFLQNVARKRNCRYIVTAHHRDDQVETVLFRLFRGTGVGGLGGIPSARVVDESLTIMRPMLHVSKHEIESALREWNQSWRSDASNAASKYTRNFIRNELLPKIRERFESADDSILRLSQQAAEQAMFLKQSVAHLFGAVTFDGATVIVHCAKLCDESPVLLRELFAELFRQQSWPISQLGYRELDRLAQLVAEDLDEPRFQLPGAINCEKRAGEIRLAAEGKFD